MEPPQKEVLDTLREIRDGQRGKKALTLLQQQA
jgi:hypothetical protein